MKKIILNLLLVITIFFSLVIINTAKELSVYNTIINGHEKIIYNETSEKKKHTNDAINYFRKIVKQYNVGLTKVTYLSDRHIILNTNENNLLKNGDQDHK
ncbi:hypothetical protein [Staphylococcus saccharolyticus]|mgnify:CR=1 FL=1|uniref:hypothetical protein n=1 Tax=Staphylococcus saccharolyticus TaxID=33028 RepID=UPI001EE454D3|nr:hypothetical protein [Staphylococcus saccharolyticus]